MIMAVVMNRVRRGSRQTAWRLSDTRGWRYHCRDDVRERHSGATCDDKSRRSLCLVLTAGVAHAQNFPAKPVRVITPFTAGSAIDTLARVLGQKMGDAWGQQVVIDNRIGANGIIGTEAAAKAPADGYTLYLGNIATLAINPHLYTKLPYDAVKDFAPITLAATIQVVLVVHPSLPAKSVKELIALAKAHPGEINYASGGNGSAQHLPMEMLGCRGRHQARARAVQGPGPCV